MSHQHNSWSRLIVGKFLVEIRLLERSLGFVLPNKSSLILLSWLIGALGNEVAIA